MKEEHLCKHYATNTGEREIGGFVFAWLKSAKERAALITAVAAIIVGVSGFYANKTFQAAQKGQTAASTRPFTLRVMDDAGSPIPHATVIAFQDQGVGQTLTTDSNGQIEVQVAPDTHSLRFTVTADGFANSTIQASIGRTGPEEVYLHPYVPSPQDQPRS